MDGFLNLLDPFLCTLSPFNKCYLQLLLATYSYKERIDVANKYLSNVKETLDLEQISEYKREDYLKAGVMKVEAMILKK
jgi:hypothetical protein